MTATKDKTHCRKGHPYDKDNTIQGKGYRRCRACAVAQKIAWRAKRTPEQIEAERARFRAENMTEKQKEAKRQRDYNRKAIRNERQRAKRRAERERHNETS